MDNTHKLLLAMCEALDLEVEEVTTRYVDGVEVSGKELLEAARRNARNGANHDMITDVDYKVTKKTTGVMGFDIVKDDSLPDGNFEVMP